MSDPGKMNREGNNAFIPSLNLNRTPPVKNPGNNFSCKKCEEIDTSEMVQCDQCDNWFHFDCVNVDADVCNRDWLCETCTQFNISTRISQETSDKLQVVSLVPPRDDLTHQNEHPESSLQRRTNSEIIQRDLLKQIDRSTSCNNLLKATATAHQTTIDNTCKATSTHKSMTSHKSSHHSRTSSKSRLQLELRKLEEEHELEKKYIKKKYEILEMFESSGSVVDDCSVIAEDEEDKVSEWLEKSSSYIPIPKNSKILPGQVPATVNKNAIATGIPANTQIPRPVHVIPEIKFRDSWIGANTMHQQVVAQSISCNPITTTNTNQMQSTNPIPTPIVANNTVRALHQSHNTANKYDSILPSTSNGSNALIPTLSRNNLAARQVMPKELPSFAGQPEDWPIFISSYESSSNACGFTNEENLIRLQKCLKGRALETVRSRLLIPSNVPTVISTLRMLYGRPELIIHTLLKNIRKEPKPEADKLETLINYALSVQNLCAVMESSGLLNHLCNPTLLQELTDRLPAHIKLNWAIYKSNIAVVTLSTLGAWLSQIAQAASDVTLPIDDNIQARELKSVQPSKKKAFVNTHCKR